MRIVVTGASGFVGGHASAALRAHGFNVKSWVRGPGVGDHDEIVNFASVESLAFALRGVDVVVHAAGMAHVGSNAGPAIEAAFRTVNVELTGRLARAAVVARVRRLILVSSAGVLGPESPPGGFCDLATANPYDAYTRSKLHGESTVLEACTGSNVKVFVLRPPMIYGPRAPGSYRRLRAWILRGWPMPVFSTARRRSYIGIRNFCDVILAACTSDAVIAAPMLVADSEPLTAGEFASMLSRAMGKQLRTLRIPASALRAALSVAGRGSDSRRLLGAFVLDPSLAKTRLGWTPAHSCWDELSWSELQLRTGSGEWA